MLTLSHAIHERPALSGERTVLIRAEGVSVEAGRRAILEDISLEVAKGEIVTIVGPNGAGKTTLARLLLGIVQPSGGRIWRAAGLRTGYVPQRFKVEPTIPMTVERFMALGVRADRRIITGGLSETGAAHLLGEQLMHLSGGEFQRVLLARALAADPQLLVLDEPVQAVDYAGAAQLYDLISDIRDRRGCGIFLISHDLHVVLGASDRIICLNRHICCEGKPMAVANHPEYVRLFGQAAAASFGLYSHRHDHEHDLRGAVKESCHHA